MAKKYIFFFIGIFVFSIVYGLTLDEAHFNLAEKLYLQKKYALAVDELTNLITKYPATTNYNKALLYTAKCYYYLKNYEKSLSYYSILDNNAGNENDKRMSLFGKGENYYKLKQWKSSAWSFKNFAFLYKNSPVHHASLYYGGKSYEALKLIPEALVFFESIVSNYPCSPYYPEAKKILLKYKKKEQREYVGHALSNKTPTPTNLNFVDLTEGQWEITNFIEITNVILSSTQENIFSTNFYTNYVFISNTVSSTQISTVIDTNSLIKNKLSEENRKKQEEIERYKELIELKARLLELKEKAIQEKNKILYNLNSETNTADQ